MQTLIRDFLNPASEVARFLFAWSWQAFLLLAVVLVIIKLFRFRAAAIRYRVWLVGLVAVALFPLCTAFIQSFSIPQASSEALKLIVDAPQVVIARPEAQGALQGPLRSTAAEAFSGVHLWSLVFAIWAIGCGFALWRLVRSFQLSRKAQLNGQAVSFAELGCGDLNATAGLACKLSQEVSSPVLVGLWRPTILLPADILIWTTADERRAILLHEMVHAARRDQWANSFQAVLGAAFYFHPLVRYACKQLCIERELSCDESVLLFGAEASSYAESILKVAEKSVAADVLQQPAFITKKMLERRIEMIMNGDHSIWSARRWTLLILPIALIAMMLWVLVPNRLASAQHSQEPTQEEKQARAKRQKLESENEARENEINLRNKIETNVENEVAVHRENEINQMLEGAEILARVSELRLIYGKRYNETERLLQLSAEETVKIGDEIKHSNVVVKTPEFTFRGEHAVENHDIINILGNPLEVEHNGRVYYSYNAIALAQRNGMVLYVVSKHGNLYTEKNQLSEPIEFNELLRRSTK